MDFKLYADVFLKLMLALILGGAVGFEREHKSRPAGLRTHILICIGAALVQITAINYIRLNSLTGIDPMRLGAQVISGIGFLGAGTILKEGANIKGLTTAASTWAVGCIGLAAGSGLYFEATLATILILLSLKGFKKIETRLEREKKNITIELTIDNKPGTIGRIGGILGNLDIHIVNIEINEGENSKVDIEMLLKLTRPIDNNEIIDAFMASGIDNIKILN